MLLPPFLNPRILFIILPSDLSPVTAIDFTIVSFTTPLGGPARQKHIFCFFHFGSINTAIIGDLPPCITWRLARSSGPYHTRSMIVLTHQAPTVGNEFEKSAFSFSVLDSSNILLWTLKSIHRYPLDRFKFPQTNHSAHVLIIIYLFAEWGQPQQTSWV